MKALVLLKKATEKLEKNANFVSTVRLENVFGDGANWMRFWMLELRPNARFIQISAWKFTGYGMLKYAISLLFFGTFALLFYQIQPFLAFFSVFSFYFVEVHFLFLFPLLIENKKNPICESIKMTYQIGLFNAIKTVMLIAFFMLIGLFNFKNPLKNWHIGCLAVVLWYEEITNGLSPQN
jgi:hypothetical protein